MAVNSDKPDRWKGDIARSVDFYNDWFLNFAPKAYRDTRGEATKRVEAALKATDNLKNVTSAVMRNDPRYSPCSGWRPPHRSLATA